jgi:SAM-dependent methyltransferase
VPYVPTPDEVVKEMLKMANVSENDVLYDLGCGDGRIVITAAKEIGCRGVGIDIDPVRIEECLENAKNAGVEDKVEFFLMDLFDADLSQATVVTLYLLSKVNLRLRPKLFRELRAGARVVSHDFSMGTWRSDNSTVVEEKLLNYKSVRDPLSFSDYWDKHNIYFWIIPANASGVWEWTMPAISGETLFTLVIEQTFQEIVGKASEGSSGLEVEIKDGKIVGNRLEFSLERKNQGQTQIIHCEGFVEGHTMRGFYEIEGIGGVKQRWQARRIPSTMKTIDE